MADSYDTHPRCQAFDVTRKSTYTHLSQWYKELRTYCEHIPVFIVANKIDVDYKVTLPPGGAAGLTVLALLALVVVAPRLCCVKLAYTHTHTNTRIHR